MSLIRARYRAVNTIMNLPRGGFVGLLDLYPNAAAAYSLRKLRAAYSGAAVRVRRSSDNTEQDIAFDANGDLDTASLLSFVNEDVVVYTSDFSSGSEDLGEFNGVGSDGETIAGVSDAYKFTLTGGSVVHFATLNLPEYNQIYSITLDYYIPSGQTVTDIEASLGTTSQHTLDVTGAWTTETFTFVASDDSSPNNRRLRFVTNAYTNVNADGDVFYLKNIVVTQTTADGHVTTWYDQSLSNNATQSTAANQPMIVSAGSLVTENAKAAIDFDGVNDYFIGAAKTTMDNTAIFVVFKSDSNTQDSVIIQNAIDGNNCANIGLGNIGTSNAIGSRLRVGGSTVDRVGDSTFTATDQTLVSYIADNTAGQMFVDGIEETDLSDSRSSGSNTTIGARGDGAHPFNGAIQEVIFFDSDQSANRTAIEANINNFYSIYP